MDCIICQSKIKESGIGSCRHHFCFSCLINWCENGGTSCPICKTFIYEIKRDLEFDILLNQIYKKDKETQDNFKSLINFLPTNTINIYFNKNEKAGITLENNFRSKNLLKRGPGVKIIKINSKDKCYTSGLRINDVIISLNNIPCIDHKQSIDIIDFCMTRGLPLSCIILRTNY